MNEKTPRRHAARHFRCDRVSFDAIADPKERAYFMNLPTSFKLPDEAVDRLRELGGRLLRESKPYRTLLRQVEASNLPAREAPKP